MERKYFPLVYVEDTNQDVGLGEVCAYGHGHDSPQEAHQFALEEIVPNPITRYPDGTGAYRKYTYRVQELWVFLEPANDE